MTDASRDEYEPKRPHEYYVSVQGSSEEEKEIVLQLLLDHLNVDVVQEPGYYGPPTYRLARRLP